MKNLLIAVALLAPSFASAVNVGGALEELMSTAPEGANVPVPSVNSGPARAARGAAGEAPISGFASAYTYGSERGAQAALDERIRGLTNGGYTITNSGLRQAARPSPNGTRYWAYFVEYRAPSGPTIPQSSADRPFLPAASDRIRFISSPRYDTRAGAQAALDAAARRLSDEGRIVVSLEVVQALRPSADGVRRWGYSVESTSPIRTY